MKITSTIIFIAFGYLLFSQTVVTNDISHRLKEGEICIVVEREIASELGLPSNYLVKSPINNEEIEYQYYYNVYDWKTSNVTRYDLNMGYEYERYIGAYLRNIRRFGVDLIHTPEYLSAYEEFFGQIRLNYAANISTIYFKELPPILLKNFRILENPEDKIRISVSMRVLSYDELFFETAPIDVFRDKSLSVSNRRLYINGTNEITNLSNVINNYNQLPSAGLQCLSCCESHISHCKLPSNCSDFGGKNYRFTTSSLDCVDDEVYSKLGIGIFYNLYIEDKDIYTAFSTERARVLNDNSNINSTKVAPLIEIE